MSFSPLDVRYLDRRLRSLINPFTYVDKEFGDITVPSGFVTDFASLGALRNIVLFALYSLLAGYGDRAAVIHDYLYIRQPTMLKTLKKITRREADDIFYRALREEGIAKWRAWMFWFGVRIGAKPAWKRYANMDNPVHNAVR